MTFVVTEACIKCKLTDCVEVCPVDCFHEGPNFLVIDPDECIDCGACVPACPVEAIFHDEDVPAQWQEYIEINEKYSQEWPLLTEERDQMPEAEKYAEVTPKRHLFSEAPGAGD